MLFNKTIILRKSRKAWKKGMMLKKPLHDIFLYLFRTHLATLASNREKWKIYERPLYPLDDQQDYAGYR